MKKSRVRLGQLTIIAASIQLIFADPALANPTGPQIVNGAASIQRPNASTLSITNTPGTIINWQGFSIGAGEVTRFIQESSSSAVLNRVVGADISQIHGQLLSNGRVFLINPSGIVIGPGATIDTAGFVASTLNMLDGDFLAGKLKFEGDANSGSIVNQGWIRTGYGGQVILVAPQVENSGLIHTPGGEILLAAGKKMTITSLDLEGVQFEVQAPTDSVLNIGKLLADGGAVGVFAGSLRHSGEIRANALVYDEAGRIVLQGQNEVQIAAGSTTSADGKVGGGITVQSGGLTRVAGSVSAQGSAGQGGDVKLLGDRVAVVENASVNASGSAGGGQILVGGDFQGGNAEIQNATSTFVGADASLRADATAAGDGGRVIVWSDDKAQYYGSLSAQGGPEGGDGGFAEVSGKQNLVFAGSANLSAPKGKLGDLLLDPLDLYVFSGGGLDPSIIDENTDFPTNAATVSPATLEAIGGNVTLFASRHMRISDPIDFSATPGKGLTAQVDTYTAPASPDPLALSTSVLNRLEIGADITTMGGAVSLSAPRIASFNSPTISTAGGAISLNAGQAIDAFSLTLNAGSGTVMATAGTGGIDLGDVGGGSFTATTPSSIDVGDVATGSGSVSLTGDNGVFTNTVDTSGSVILNASAGSIFSKVNNASALTASAGFSAFINSDTNINVDTVAAGGFGTASLFSSGGAIRANSASSQVTGFDVTLSSTDTGTGGGIGTAGTALNVNVQRQLSFTTNAGFNVMLNGSGPNALSATLNPANATTGSYAGSSITGSGFSLMASADTSTVTLNDLTISNTAFNQFSSFIIVNTSGNLVANSVSVPTGNTTFNFQLPVSFFVGGDLTLNSYTRAAGGMLNTTTINSGGAVTLGSIDAGNDQVSVFSSSGITLSSVMANGNVTLNTFGAVNAQAVNAGLEITAGGTLNITGAGIGTTNRLDLAAPTISLTSRSNGAIGGVNPVIANTQDLIINAASGSTFNVSTGSVDIKNLTVTANPTSVAGGLAQVSSNGALYDFNNDVDNTRFTFDLNAGAIPPAQFDGGALNFTSNSGDINLVGSTNLGTGSLMLRANGGSIASGGSGITAANVELSASAGIDLGTGAVTASGTGGNVMLRAGTTIDTGDLNASGSIDIRRFSFSHPVVSVTGDIGNVTPAQSVSIVGSTVSTGLVDATDVRLQANGGLLTIGPVTAGGIVDLSSFGATPFQFSSIDAGTTGTVNITSPNGIQQLAGGAGITAQTVALRATGGDILGLDSFPGGNHLDLLNGSNPLSLTVDAGGQALFHANGNVLSRLDVTKRTGPDADAFGLMGLAGGQSISIGGGASDLEISLSSSSPLEFRLSYFTGDAIKLTGAISTGGGSLFLNSSGSIDASAGAITTGGGAVDLLAFGPITTGAIDTSGSGGPINIESRNAAGHIVVGGNLTTGTGGGLIRLDANNGGNITRSGAFSINSDASVEITTSNGEIGASGTPLLITSPDVTLNADRGFAALGNEGLVTATLTDTSVLDLTGAFGFNVTNTNTAFTSLSVSTRGSGTGAVSLAAPGQTFGFTRAANDLFLGPIANTFELVEVSGAALASGTFSVSDGTLLVAGSRTINATNLTLSSTNGADISLQGTAANPLSLSNTTQTFSATGGATADLLMRGKITLAAASAQSFSANGNITINADAGGGGAVTIGAPDQTFATTGAASKIELLGGAAAGEKITVTSTNAQTVNTASNSVDSFRLKGGSGTDASVTFSHSGSGFQDFEISNGTITIEGGSGANSFAKIEETGTNQQEICRVTPFFGCVPVGSLRILGGSGAGAFAELTADGSQRVLFSNALTVQGGTGAGAYALLQAGTTQQIFGGSSLTVTAGGAGQIAEPFVAVPGASAIIEGQNQFISLSGAVTINGGAGIAGSTSDALIRNLSGTQVVSGGSITLNGGHTQSTTGILNLGSGIQNVSGGSGILLRSDPNLPPAHADSFVLIQNQAATAQTLTASSGGITLSNSGSGTVDVTSAGTQNATARFLEVLTSAGSTGSATLSATGDQYIRTTDENANGESVVVAALGSGTAKIESGASQLLEVGYPNMMLGLGGSGLLALGQANGIDAAGNSLVHAVDQNVFAGSVVVQGPSGGGATSKLSATNTQTISTLLGGIDVIGGTGANSLATIDPLIQTIVANGSVVLEGGPGPGANADASILSGGPQTIFATNGDILLTGGLTSGSDAIISNIGAQQGCALLLSCGQPQTLVASGSIILSQPLGSAVIQGGFTTSSSGPATFLSSDATQQTLSNVEELLLAFSSLAPDAQEPDLRRQVPICR